MKIHYAKYVTSALWPDQWPRDDRPEIAFAGRSNVGKSTLLNVLLNVKGLAKTSKRPGKTQTLNFFDVNGRVYFVDLPGYGFAKVNQELKEAWGQAVTSYLTQRKTLRLVVHLVDCRHAPTPGDLELIELLAAAKRPVLHVATKADKLGAAEAAKSLKALAAALRLSDPSRLVPFSSISKLGIRDVWRELDGHLK